LRHTIRRRLSYGNRAIGSGAACRVNAVGTNGRIRSCGRHQQYAYTDQIQTKFFQDHHPVSPIADCGIETKIYGRRERENDTPQGPWSFFKSFFKRNLHL
jgi:hypothetical protein